MDLKFKRLQYIAYEPVVGTVAITNLAGRDIELHDADGQSWLGFEITGSEEQPIAPLSGANREPRLREPRAGRTAAASRRGTATRRGRR